MKKSVLHKLGLFILVSVLTLSFSSCEENGYWKAATLDVGADARISNIGYFVVDIQIRDIDIQGFRASEDLLDINLLNTRLELYQMDRLSSIEGLLIEADENLYYEHRGSIFGSDGSLTGIVENGAYHDFMYDVMRAIRRYGYVNVRVSGYSRNSIDSYISIDFINNLDIRVRD